MRLTPHSGKSACFRTFGPSSLCTALLALSAAGGIPGARAAPPPLLLLPIFCSPPAAGPAPTIEEHIPFAELTRSLAIESDGQECPSSIADLWEQQVGPTPPSNAAWACHMLMRNLALDGTPSCMPDPRVVLAPPARGLGNRLVPIQGVQYYEGMVPGDYRYDLAFHDDGTISVHVRIRLQGPAATPESIERMQAAFKSAEQIWNASSPLPRGSLKFDFQALGPDDPRPAHLAVELASTGDRSPYFLSWQAGWSSEPLVVAHELGHVMGLQDEYDQFRATFMKSDRIPQYRCDNDTSLMCSSHFPGVQPQRYHYYLLLGRAWCRS